MKIIDKIVIQVIIVIVVAVTAGELFYYYNKRPRDILSIPVIQKFLSWVKEHNGRKNHLTFDGISFVRINPGRFVMGSEHNEPGHDRQLERKRNVTISWGFALSVYEISESQYWHIVDPTRHIVNGKENKPITEVSWKEAVKFCKMLSGKYDRKFRLPKEIEWEYAARGGEVTNRMFGVWEGDWDKMLESWERGDKSRIERRARTLFNFASNGTHDLGTAKKPNAFGLLDMHGNVWEWCNEPSVSDPNTPSLYHRPIRGGAWTSQRCQDCRSAKRAWERYDRKKSSIGFRVLLENP